MFLQERSTQFEQFWGHLGPYEGHLGLSCPISGGIFGCLGCGLVWFGLVGLVGLAGKYNEKCKFYFRKTTFVFQNPTRSEAPSLGNLGDILGLMRAILCHFVPPR